LRLHVRFLVLFLFVVNEFLVSKETVMLRRWKKHENLVLSRELVKVELPPWKIWKADLSSVSPSSDRIDHFTVVCLVAF